jgi:hypothetical protein
LGALFLARAFAVKKPAKTALVPSTPSKLAGRTAIKAPSKAAVVHSCNVLEVGPQAKQLWQFEARGSSYVLSREHTSMDGHPLPGRIVGKDWRALFQKKLNIAWLPPENVFLRVVQLPWSDFTETLSMVELQLEKLSPMPVAQICWSFHSLPHAQDNQQTIIVMIVARSVVEEFLGQLEGQGYIADRLELPLLDQLQTTAITEDGAWIYPEASAGKNSALVAWWYGGVLQNLDLLTLPQSKTAEGLKEQLLQMAWAGELEGWLTSPPEWHLVADIAAAQWEPHLRAGLEQPIDRIGGVDGSTLRPGGPARKPAACRICHKVPTAIPRPALDAQPVRARRNLPVGRCDLHDRARVCQFPHQQRGALCNLARPHLYQRDSTSGPVQSAQGTPGIEICRFGLLEYDRPLAARKRNAR